MFRKIILEIEEREALKYNNQHSAERALAMGSIDEIVKAGDLKEAIIRVQEATIKMYEQNRELERL